MLKKSLALILAVTVVMAAGALFVPAAPAVAQNPPTLEEGSQPQDTAGWWTSLRGLWQTFFGEPPLGVIFAAVCDENDHCGENPCHPELCECNSDPCHKDACNPEACQTGGGGNGGQGPRIEPGG